MTNHIDTPEYDREEYGPGRVANYMLDKAEREGISISPMKLQKLVYNGYGWVRAILGNRLFKEGIEAWEHGPVIPSLYHEFKHTGWRPIKVRSMQFHPFASEQYDPELPTSITEEKVCEVLDIVWDVYKNFTASDLRKQTHGEKTPWHEARYPDERDTPVMGGVINDELIKEYFESTIRAYLDELS